MPNSLVHFALQIPLTRAAAGVDMIKWGMLGCIVPDIPWIAQRGIKFLHPGIDLYDLRIYCAVQASLLLCLVFSAFAASIARMPIRVFAVVGLNSAVHLILDAMETKWANGVNLMAPVDWSLWNYGLLWPEHWIVALLSVLGAGIAVFYAWFLKPLNSGLMLSIPFRLPLAVLFLLGYLFAPLLFMEQARESNMHYVATLSSGDRSGRVIEIDRTAFIVDEKGSRVKTFANETIEVVGELPDSSGQISLKGRFKDHRTISVSRFHSGQPMFRDSASVLALILFAVIWFRYLQTELPWRRSRNRTDKIGQDYR